MQFKASYIIDIIANQITVFEASKVLESEKENHNIEALKMRGLLKQLSAFEADGECFKGEFEYKNLNPILSTVNNIITRGLPTKAPVCIEEEIACAIGATKRNQEKKSVIQFVENNYKIERQTIFELLHIIYPKLNIDREKYVGNLANGGEWNFINEKLKATPFIKQVLQSQRPFKTIAPVLADGRTVDFAYEIPYLHKSFITETDGKIVFEKFITKGVIFEFDGQQHHLQTIKTYDNYRDTTAEDANFETLRQPSEAIEMNEGIESQFRKDIWGIFEKNYNRNIEEWLKEFILIFTPIAVARIQKTLIEFFLRNEKYLKKDSLSIAIIERDVPCAELGIKSFIEIFNNLSQLITEEFHSPEFNLTVFENNNFSDYDLNKTCKKGTNFNEKEFDIILDIATLFRSNIYDDQKYQSNKKITIRSSHFYDNSFGNARRTYCASPLHYKPLGKNDSTGTFKANELGNNVEFFIQNIFRKPSFREGQLPIISRALQLLPVIGLLPTGGGKSLTFQLSALMQPGICIVVDPIKSLMEDQVRVLNNNWIDCCDYLNGNITATIRRNKHYHLRFGESQLMFLSPERFVMEEFRNLVKGINALWDLSITYCVIDEVHCVSEWGQNFRDTYLFLGKNAQRFCSSKNPKENGKELEFNKVSLIGLTATASYDVLADVERELKIEHSNIANALIMTENTIRPEMFFRVVEENTLSKSTALNNDIENIGNNLQYWNSKKIIEKSIKHHVEEFNQDENISENVLLINKDLSKTVSDEHCAIVFCATKSNFQRLSLNSVCEVFTNFKSNNKGYYFGTDRDDDAVNEQVQIHFNNFINNNLQHVIATKAFGMGIDKEDVRAVYHINYSNSLEAFVQEAGRAGRDKKISESVVFFNSQILHSISPNILSKENCENPKNEFLRNNDYRKRIRWNFLAKLSAQSLSELKDLIDITPLVEPHPNVQIEIKEFLKNNIIERKSDRRIQDYFYNLNFKGIDSEKSKIDDLLFKDEGIFNQSTLEIEFEKCNENKLSFSIKNTKQYPSNLVDIMKTLEILITNQNTNEVLKLLNRSLDYYDFLLQIKETTINTVDINEDIEKQIKYYYCRERGTIETGKLIYRMSCMGLLEDYTIDFVTQQRICVFVKAEIGFYLKEIYKYLERYLSEKTTIEVINKLRKRLENAKTAFLKIAECLNFLTEFSYEQVAKKQERALTEIENLMLESIAIKDKFEQNIHIKEFIYFYFNAKYARIDYSINGESFSLLYDSDTGTSSTWDIVTKYTDIVLKKETGTPNNNYKHLIGSGRKITRGMVEEELKREWSLKLISAYAQYCVNVPSYTNNGNEFFYEGLKIFYKSDICQTNFQTLILKYDEYIESLQTHVDNVDFWGNTDLVLHNVILEDVLTKTIDLLFNHKQLMQQYKN